jgi:hypothetical protein
LFGGNETNSQTLTFGAGQSAYAIAFYYDYSNHGITTPCNPKLPGTCKPVTKPVTP